MLEFCVLTPAEIAEFGYQEPATINWGVKQNSEPVVYLSAEPEAEGWWDAHIAAKRRRVHPTVLRLLAGDCIKSLFDYGAVGLICEIAPHNKAALRLARALGFTEAARNDEWVTLVLRAPGQDHA